MQLAEELRISLQAFLAGASVEIRENGTRLTARPPLSWEVRGASEKPLLHLWGENCNMTRRVLAIADQNELCLGLSVERFGRGRPDRLEILRLNFERDAKKVSREAYCAQLRRILSQQFPDETIEKLSVAPDLEHSLSGMYARGVAMRGHSPVVFLAVPDEGTPDSVEQALSYALLWHSRVGQAAGRRGRAALRLIVPLGKSMALCDRLAALDPHLRVQLYELDAQREEVARLNPGEGNQTTWLVARGEAQMLLERAAAELAPIIALAPEAISLHPSVQEKFVLLRYRGLAFARWQDSRVYFDVNGLWMERTQETNVALQQLVLNLRQFRDANSNDVRHPLYRAKTERWLQSLVMQDVSRVDLQLDTALVYEQVLAESAGRHGILDLLCATRGGRLAILELKTSEHLHLPLQAAEYWVRIRRHQSSGDLLRYGYFPGRTMQAAAPVVYLVAPALHFHPSTETLLSYLHPEMEVRCVGLAEYWRRALRVVTRK